MNGNTFAGDFIIGFLSKHRRVSVMFSDNYLPRGGELSMRVSIIMYKVINITFY